MSARSAASCKGKWLECPGDHIGARGEMIIKALGLRKRGPDFPRVFGMNFYSLWRYRRRMSRPPVAFIVRIHRLEEIYAKEIQRMREAEAAYGGFKKIPTEVLESLWRRANKGIKKD